MVDLDTKIDYVHVAFIFKKQELVMDIIYKIMILTTKLNIWVFIKHFYF